MIRSIIVTSVRRYNVLLILCLACGLLPGTTTGYGTSGHRIVGNLAWYQLSKETKEWIYDLIQEDRFWYGIEMTTICSSEDKCKPLGAIAEWADDVKKSEGVSHAIAVPGLGCLAEGAHEQDPDCRLNYGRDCENDDCVVGQIVKFAMVLQDWMWGTRRRDRKLVSALNLLGFLPVLLQFFADFWGMFFGDSLDRALDSLTGDREHEALMFVTHLMGDLHQPLHCGQEVDSVATTIDVTYMGYHNEDSRSFWCSILPGFLKVVLGCGDVSLHSAWDFSILMKYMDEEFSGNRENLEDSIWYEYIEDNEEQKASWLSCLPDPKGTPYLLKQSVQDCVMEWANDSLEIALKYGYRNIDGSYIVSGTDLTEEYHYVVVPIVRKQLAMGSVRLAALLERVLNPDQETPSASPALEYAPSESPSDAPPGTTLTESL